MSENKPRYSRVSDILDLAIFMSSKIQGVTITEIAERYGVSRRTAERMRDSLTCIFPAVDEIETKDNQKHWGFINYSISHLISFTPKEIGNIEQLQRRTTNKEMKEELSKTIEKLKSLNKKNKDSIENLKTIMRITNDIEVKKNGLERKIEDYNFNIPNSMREKLKFSIFFGVGVFMIITFISTILSSILSTNLFFSVTNSTYLFKSL